MWQLLQCSFMSAALALLWDRPCERWRLGCDTQMASDVRLACAGPISSFLVVSDPEAAKHVLRSSDNPQRAIYNKARR